MIRNYLTTAYRNLRRHALLSAISILGLSVAVAASVLILEYAHHELTYDTFQAEHERIYRVQTDTYQQGELTQQSAYTVPALAPAVASTIPGVADYFRLTSWAENYTLLLNDSTPQARSFRESAAIFADPAFVRYFDLRLRETPVAAVLDAPNQLLISESTARRYYGPDWQRTLRAGQETVLVYTSNRDQTTNFVIQGVYEDLPSASHLAYDLIFSHTSLPNFLPAEIPEADRRAMFKTSWGPSAWYTYLVLDPSTSPKRVAGQITDLVAARNPDAETKEQFQLQALSSIHLHSNLMNEASANGSATWVYVLLAVAGLVLLTAGINYLNLAAAQALQRTKEINVRKIIGARRGQVSAQFLTEALLTNGLAVAGAVALVYWARPYWQEVMNVPFGASPFYAWGVVIPLLLLIVLLVGWYAPRVHRAPTLSGSRAPLLTAVRSGSGMNRGLMVLQLAICLFLVSATLAVYQQVRYMQQQDLGIRVGGMLVVEGPNVLDQEVSFEQTVERWRNALGEVEAVAGVSAASYLPGDPSGLTRTMHRRGAGEERSVELREVLVEPQYLPTLEAEFVVGSNFSTTAEGNRQRVILNEAAVRALGFATAAEALGTRLGMYGFQGVSEYEIIGVVKNYHQTSLQTAYQPIAFFAEIYSGDYLVSLAPMADVGDVLAEVEQRWASSFPGNPFQYYFLNDHFAQQYQRDERFGTVLRGFSLMALLLACLGLLGLTRYAVGRRTKEIGIRKVLGASVPQVVLLLSRDAVRRLLLASVIALPLAYGAVQQWLNQYAFRIDVLGWWWLLPVGGVFALVVLTVGLQTGRAARANPVDSLRYE